MNWNLLTNNKKKLSLKGICLCLLLTILSACSEKVSNFDNFVSCNNGTNPLPLERDFKFSGDLLFVKQDGSEVFAFNGDTHELVTVFHKPSEGFYDVSTLSGDGKTLVIFHQDTSDMKSLSITVLSNNGLVETKKIPLPSLGQNRNKEVSWYPISWVNANYVQGVLYEKGNTGDELWDTWLLNPYQLEWKSLGNIVENLDRAEASGFSISPDMSRILYVNQKYQLILYDLPQNKPLWEYSDYDGINPEITSPILADAVWSNDGKILALPISQGTDGNNPGILELNLSGEILNLMDFGMRQFGFSLSPDGHYLSFYGNQFLGLDPQSDIHSIIRVMDLKTGLVRDLCMLGINIEPTGKILWSPDQKFLAYYLNNSKGDPDKFIVQQLTDPRLRTIQFDGEHKYSEFLGWSRYHWTSANHQP